MEKIKTFETLKNERQLKRYLGSPYGTLYYPLDEQQGNRTMVRHFDSDLPSEFIAEYIELYGLVKQWVDSNPNVNEIVFITDLVSAGEDYIVRSFYPYHIAIEDYFEGESSEIPELFKQMQKVVLGEFNNSLKNNNVLRRIIENSLLKPNGKSYYNNSVQKIIIAEPKITGQDLEEWRDLKRYF